MNPMPPAPDTRLRMLVAPDSFKGTYSAEEVCDFIAEGAAEVGAQVDLCPLADGGEGTLSVLVGPLGLELRELEVDDALGRRVKAPIGFGADGLAVIESAAAIGLAAIPAGERDPIVASSRGVGELIAHARDGGARRISIGVGGSATVDGGAGAIRALGPEVGLAGLEVEVLCDVETVWERAASVFGPQKGAAPEGVAFLSARMDELAASLPRDPRGVPMSGAAGGLSGALWALGATLVPGADRVLDLLGFEQRLAGADLVVTGEGSLDSQSMEGKLVGRVTERAHRAGVGVVAVVGRLGSGRDAIAALGLDDVIVAGTPTAMRAAGRQLAGDLS
jgi:glycerate kinase